LVLDLPLPEGTTQSEFLLAGSNAAAIEALRGWRVRSGGPLAVHGPAGCGKTYLALEWCERHRGLYLTPERLSPIEPILAAVAAGQPVALDNAEQAAQQPLLHLYNWCGEHGAGPVLFSRVNPASWPATIPDLVSRLRAIPSLAIAPPDDDLLRRLLFKRFAE